MGGRHDRPGVGAGRKRGVGDRAGRHALGQQRLELQLHHKVEPSAFTTLRKGGPANAGQVDAVVFQGGRIWHATGDTYLPAVFQQQ